MCGLAGIFAYHQDAQALDQRELVRIREAMRLRGPDGAGLWISKKIGLAHRRLSIIDLSEAAQQPMSTEDDRLKIVFNGELYNHIDLRAHLEQKGYRFRSNSDTEVLLHLYAEYGLKMVDHLRGMFSFALWDNSQKSLFLARDHFGIKPLYYSDDGKTLRFASQVKALLESQKIDASPEPAGHAGFFLWGHVPEPYTLYKGIRALPPGSFLWIDESGKKQRGTFFNLTDELANAISHSNELNPAEREERLTAAIADSVRRHLVADVPIGLFLSSGLDSSMLTAHASQLQPAGLRTMTLGFKELQNTEHDETILAAAIADHYATLHRTDWITRDDFNQDMERLLRAMDQPSIDGINTFFISKMAAKMGLKVAVSGVGGDELFAGYPSFSNIPDMIKKFAFCKSSPPIGKAFRMISSPILKRFTSPKFAGLLEYGGHIGGAYLLRRGLFMPWELPEVLDKDLACAGWEALQTLARLEETVKDIDNDRLKVFALETHWYMKNRLLRDMDWAGMAHSVEIRTPLVDIALFRKILPLLVSKNHPTKRDMANTAIKKLPNAVLNRPKTGFEVPVRDWLLQRPSAVRERGLRGWARIVYKHYSAP